MNREKQVEIRLLDYVVSVLQKMPLETRHRIMVGLMAWFIAPAPADVRGKLLHQMADQAIELIKASDERAKKDAPPDLRH